MDRIVVMEAGRIVETGSYDQLIDQEGSFAEFLVKHLEQTPETESDDGLCLGLVFKLLVPHSVQSQHTPRTNT